ncbi:interferon-inducible GTPase 1-like isoform X2 [Ruditapes philippinarum]|uniref:interferon-inducible GTPase 1-like isoform X2 n=1 Tax=Ruditapes philippinarum TaxID=129788 RepID=UPI00295B156E|nr:interferon-inducible GTPase 1-like isoform X2 [Ruditapes philippinarum]XP_060584642.1 interferon-inducible GTPase 1-like isoform X2 [Ruditapes philippinarum]XP_060584643.1 interferon-inducible GTPase 1-like isoform X2 [Ruditapes philippinarum]
MACSKLEPSTKSKPLQPGKWNVAVTGKSGAGKSSFINAVLGLKVGHAGAADTDVKECTNCIMPYHTPNMEHVVLWDLPGLGTDTYKKDNYVEKLNLFEYDFFLVLGSERFTENELWLASIIKNSNKEFYFVRTKIYNDIITDALGRTKPRSKEEILLTIRSDCYYNLQQYGLTQRDIYLIDNFHAEQYDFPSLLLNLNELSLKFRMDYILTCYSHKKQSFLHKRKILLETAENVATEATTRCKEQVPGLGASVNIEVLLRETRRYMEQFEQTSDDIENHEEVTGWNKEMLQDLLKRNIVEINCSENGILEFCKDIELCELMDVHCGKPIKNKRPTKSWSFKIVLQYLNGTVDILYHNALRINEEIVGIIMQGR